MRRCILIGGGGFIGSHLAARLSETRAVVVVDARAQPSLPLPASVEFMGAHYDAPGFLQGLLREDDDIVHLAYATVPKTSFDDPVEDIQANLPSSVRLFEAAVRANVRRVVLLSSGGTIYGASTAERIPEQHATEPISPYGITKLALEKYAHMFHVLKGLDVVTVRPANAYGEGQRPFAGQGFVATAIGSILQGKSITVFGEHGTTRDYVHIDDVVCGIRAALDRGQAGTAYNIGTGMGATNGDILRRLRMLAAADNLPMEVTVLPVRKFDVLHNVLDATLLMEHTGFKPTIDLDSGLARFWRWCKVAYCPTPP